MAANISIVNGIAEAAYARTEAWHKRGHVFLHGTVWSGLGTVVDGLPDSAAMLVASHLNWQVKQRQLAIINDDGEVIEKAPQFVANQREDTGAILGIVSAGRYHVVQNSEGFAFLDRLVAGGDIVRYESAFALSGGRRVCVVARLPEADRIVDGDVILRYVMLSLDHSGGGAIQVGPTSVRVVCENTYAAAMSEGHVRSLSISHTGDIDRKLEQARAALGQGQGLLIKHADTCRKLAQTHMDREMFREFLDVICPALGRHDPSWSERREKAIAYSRQRISDAYEIECDLRPDTRDTVWAAWNAVTDTVDHMPRKGGDDRARYEARFRVSTNGTGHAFKRMALRTAASFANVKEEGTVTI